MSTTGINTKRSLARFQGVAQNGAAPLIVNDGSITGVQRTAAGVYDVTFGQPTDPTKRVVKLTAENAVPVFPAITAWNVANTVATISVTAPGAAPALTDPAFIHLSLDNGEPAVGN